MTSIQLNNISNTPCSLTAQNLARHIQTFTDTFDFKQQNTLEFATIQQSRIGTDYYSHFEPILEETTTFKSGSKKPNMKSDKKHEQQKLSTSIETDLVSEDEKFISARRKRGIPVERVGNTSLKKRSVHLKHGGQNHKLSDKSGEDDDNSITNDSYLVPRSHHQHKSKRTESSLNEQASKKSTTKRSVSANKSKIGYKKKGQDRIGSERITLKSKDKSSHHGIFNKGKASKKVETKGVPDLVFSEVHFLDDDSKQRTSLSGDEESYSEQYSHPLRKKKPKVTATISEESLEKSSSVSGKSNSIFDDYMIIDMEPPKRPKVAKTKATPAKLSFENYEKNNSNRSEQTSLTNLVTEMHTNTNVFLEKDELNEIDTILGETSMPQQLISKKDVLDTIQTDIEKGLEPICTSQDKKELQMNQQETEQTPEEPSDNEEQNVTQKDSLNAENEAQNTIPKNMGLSEGRNEEITLSQAASPVTSIRSDEIIRMINDLEHKITDNNNCNDFDLDVAVLNERNSAQDYDFDEIIGDCDVTVNNINISDNDSIEIENAIQMINDMGENEKDDENMIYFFDGNKYEWFSKQPILDEENPVSRTIYDYYSDNLQLTSCSELETASVYPDVASLNQRMLEEQFIYGGETLDFDPCFAGRNLYPKHRLH
ncbi:12793_t:CDS:2 [Ambispora leptoticha]|uniref:12793_t:CDS:1 n=1 Tax=Ambispora leptoticha TaxID=144679 RepID=A0A9N8YYH8_9GLOM|nr:12793_t:CDS:2 [Ambispora leptoticha]